MIDGLVSGKLYGKPEQRTSRSGKVFTVAKVRAAVAGDEQALFVNVLAFSTTAQSALLALDDGAALALSGSLTPKAWTDREGQARPSLDMIAEQVLTAYHVRRRRDAMTEPTEQPQGEPNVR